MKISQWKYHQNSLPLLRREQYWFLINLSILFFLALLPVTQQLIMEPNQNYLLFRKKTIDG
jgi:uncharacterized membrane protein